MDKMSGLLKLDFCSALQSVVLEFGVDWRNPLTESTWCEQVRLVVVVVGGMV